MQWLNENDDVSLEYVNGAYIRDRKDGVIVFCLKFRLLICRICVFFIVSTQLRTFAVLELGGRCFHSAHAMFRCDTKT